MAFLKEKIPREVLFRARGLHRTGRVLRGRCQAGDVGGGWCEGLEHPIPLWPAVGTYAFRVCPPISKHSNRNACSHIQPT